MKKMRKRTKFVIAAMANIIWYTIAVLILSAKEKTVPDALTVAWFSAWTVELALLAGLKVRGKEGENEND